MNQHSRSKPGDAHRRPVTFGLLRLLRVALVGAVLGGICGYATGCSSADLAKIESATKVVYQDATSEAGQQLLGSLTASALNVGLDIASGNDVGAAVAGIQGVASAIRDYEGLPTAPSSATIARAAAAGAGVANVATAVEPSVVSLIENAFKTARTQKINVTLDQVTEAIAKGFDAVAGAKGL